MKKKQIITLLIGHYEMAIRMVEACEDIGNIREITASMKVDAGVCLCAAHRFNTGIKDRKWVIRNKKKNSNYWGDCPYSSWDKEGTISLLQLRVDILKKELKRPWWKF